MYIAKEYTDGVLEPDKESGMDIFSLKRYFSVYDTNKKRFVDTEKYQFATFEEAKEIVDNFNSFKIVKTVC